MAQLEMLDLEQKIQALRDCLQDEDQDLPCEYKDRRRPGRPDHVDPNLVPLLRGKAVPALLASDGLDAPYNLQHATPLLGIAVSVVLSIPLWGVLGLVTWAVLR